MSKTMSKKGREAWSKIFDKNTCISESEVASGLQKNIDSAVEKFRGELVGRVRHELVEMAREESGKGPLNFKAWKIAKMLK